MKESLAAVTLEPDLRCYYHPDVPATSQCDRCGDYLCEHCVAELHGQYLCPKCARSVRGDPGNVVVDAVLRLAGSVIAAVSALAPVAFFVSTFVYGKGAIGIAIHLPTVCLFAALVVWAGLRARRRLDLSLALTNLAGAVWFLASRGQLIAGFVLQAFSSIVGAMLAWEAMVREEGTLRDRVFALFACVMWFSMAIYMFLLELFFSFRWGQW